jgi:hypothetical protein
VQRVITIGSLGQVAPVSEPPSQPVSQAPVTGTPPSQYTTPSQTAPSQAAPSQPASQTTPASQTLPPSQAPASAGGFIATLSNQFASGDAVVPWPTIFVVGGVLAAATFLFIRARR